MLLFKELIGSLFLLLIILMLLIEFKETIIENIFFQKYNQRITMINQLMIKSASMMKLEQLQQEKKMITQQDVC